MFGMGAMGWALLIGVMAFLCVMPIAMGVWIWRQMKPT